MFRRRAAATADDIHSLEGLTQPRERRLRHRRAAPGSGRPDPALRRAPHRRPAVRLDRHLAWRRARSWPPWWCGPPCWAGRPSNRTVDKNIFTWIPVDTLHVNFGLQLDPLSILWCLFVTGVGSLITLYSIGYMKGDSQLRPVLFLHEPVPVLDDRAGPGGQLPLQLPRLGRRGLLLLRAGRLLVRARQRGGGGQEGLRHQPHRRLRVHDRPVPDVRALPLVQLLDGAGPALLRARQPCPAASPPAWGSCCSSGRSASRPRSRCTCGSRRHGGPHSGVGPHPRRHHGHRRRLPDGPQRADLPLQLVQPSGWSPSSASATALFAATIACAQDDIKRVLAYSTISQLGYMFLAEGSGGYAAGIYPHGHARLLQGVAVPRGRRGDPRPPRRAGHEAHGRAAALPAASPFPTFIIGYLALAAIPPFDGFWSKDDVLQAAWHKSPALWAVGVVTAGLTAYYMSRQVVLVFGGAGPLGGARRGPRGGRDAAGARATGRRCTGAAPVHEGATPSPDAARGAAGS